MRVKKLMTFVAALMLTASSFSLSAADLQYVDASTLTIIGKAFPTTTHPFRRIEDFDFRQESVNRKATHSAGIAVVFKTDSRTIAAKWVTESSVLGNMNPIGCKGLDLYIKDKEGKWRYAGSGKPEMRGDMTRHSRTLVSDMAAGEKECLLYLPLYNRCDSLSLGFDAGSVTVPMDNPFRYKVFFGGSSITHGASATRAGQCYTGLLGLKHGVYAINFGFSGDFKMQKPLAEYAAGVDADVFVFDAFSNPTAEQIYANFDPFMDILRAARPTTPVIFMQTERRETRNFNMRADSLGAAIQRAAREVVARRQLKDANLYFIDSKDFLTPDGMSTADGSHPTDIAFERTVDILWPLLKHLLESKPDPKVEELMAKMTLEEKIGQLNLQDAPGDVVTGPRNHKGTDIAEDIRNGHLGNVLNAVGLDYIRSLQKIAVEESRLGIPLTFGFDEIHGYRTTFPISLAESCTWDPELISRCARAGAQEAAADGLNITYNPMVDIAVDPRWGRISEGAGEDPFLGSKIAAARVRGVQGDDLSDPLTLAACLKHYAAYGLPEGGRDYAAVEMGERRLREFYLPPYQAAVEAGVASVMTSFNLYNGIPATMNKLLVDQILRREWNYKGVVMTDYGSIGEILKHGCAENLADAARMALEAGTDMDMCSRAYVRELKGLVESGVVDMQLINLACRRVLQLKADLGLFDDPYRYLDAKRAKKVIYSKENIALSKEEAVRSMVLLKNRDETLPLKKGEKIALVGDLCGNARAYCGAWAGKCEPERVMTIEAYFKKDRIVTPQEADKIVCVLGEDHTMSGEAKSRTDIRIPAAQRELLEEMCALGKPVVLVVMAGRPLDLSRESEIASSILMAWQPGMMAAEALHDILYGKENPSGRLTASFPRNVGQIPVYHYMCNTGRPATDGKSQRYVSNYIDSWNAPLYPFGFGLSYTQFAYSDLTLSADEMDAAGSITASVTVRNTGKVAGEEVVQLYLRDKAGSVSRPVKQLKGFEKISLKAGESRTVRFTIDEPMLRFWRADMTYGSEPGEFAVFVGPDASVRENKVFRLK